MKRILGISCLILLSLCFVSCGTTHYFSIDTKKPAEVTYPDGYPRIVIANNAVLQPADVGVDFKVGNRSIPVSILPKDSAYDACLNILGGALDQTGYFMDVLVYKEPLRKDNEYLARRSISPQKLNEIIKEVYADAVISLDRLLFKTSQSLNGNIYMLCLMQTEYNADFSVYARGKTDPIYSFSLSDTLIFNDFVNPDSAFIYKELPTMIMMDACYYIADRALPKLTPHWESSDRMIYLSNNSQMKTASAYAKKDKWGKASEIWEEIYNNNPSGKQGGKVAINMAVSEEMSDRCDKALEWVDKALDCYAREKPEKVKEENDFANNYKKILEARLKDDALLNRQ